MSSSQIELRRSPSDFWFACVDIDVWNDETLSMIEKAVFTVICTHASINTRNCKLKIATIAKKAGCSVRSVQNAMKVLVKRGLIQREACFHDGKQVSSYYQVIGHNAPCYQDKSQDEGCTICAPRTTCTGGVQDVRTDNDNSFNDNNNSLTREAPLPSFTDLPPLAFENGEPVIPDDDKPLSKPEEICTPDDAPEIMKATAEYLLLKTGRKNLTWSEISALRELAVTQYPSRVQKEIDKACDRFKRKGRNLRTLTFGYIAGSLQHQPTRSVTGRAVSKTKPKPEHAELAPSTETFTEAEIAELEARVQGGGRNA